MSSSLSRLPKMMLPALLAIATKDMQPCAGVDSFAKLGACMGDGEALPASSESSITMTSFSVSIDGGKLVAEEEGLLDNIQEPQMQTIDGQY